MRRRAELHTDLVALVILVAVLLIGLAILLRTTGVWKGAVPDTDCSAQVRAHAAIANIGKELVDPSTISCPTKVISVSGEVEGRKAIADEMVRCYDQWGRGELRLFGDQEGTYCHVCGMVYVSDAGQVRGLFSYLADAKTKAGETYLEHLAPQAKGEYFAAADASSIRDVSMPTGSPIGVVFTYAKGRTTIDRFTNAALGSQGVGLTLGAAAGGGVIWLVSALTGPVGWVTGGTILLGGAIAGAVSSYILHQPLDTLAVVTARPLSADDLKDLGCDYAPVTS